MASNRESFEEMFDIIVDDILETTDEEIINEAVEDGIDIESEVANVKNIFERCRFNVAKKVISEQEYPVSAGANSVVDITEARNRLNAIAERSSESKGHLTMAARLGENIPDEDVPGYYEDLCELNLINDDEFTDDK